MRTVHHLPIDEVVPPARAILEAQGVPHFRQNDGSSKDLALEAIQLYREKANPAALIMDVAKDEFASVFNGEGRNEIESPVKPIYEASDTLALFAVTIGQALCTEISRRFQMNDFAVGSMLDAAASEGTEMAAQVVENLYRDHLGSTNTFTHRSGILRFSPGYCGWHISAQKKLFSVLRPGEIGITLNESYLMQPLKSITGVIITGEKSIFIFDDTYSFCRACADHTCRERIQVMMDQ